MILKYRASSYPNLKDTDNKALSPAGQCVKALQGRHLTAIHPQPPPAGDSQLSIVN